MAGHLPSGTVTFLFTDAEGSTALLTQIGKDAYGELLAEHHRLIRSAVGDGGGSEVDTHRTVRRHSGTLAQPRVRRERPESLAPRLSRND